MDNNFNEVEHQWQPNNVSHDSSAENTRKIKKEKKVKKPITFGKVFALCAVFMACTLAANSALIYFAYDKLSGEFMTKNEYATENIGTTSDTIQTIVSETGKGLSVAEIADAVMPSVVAITSTSIIEQSGGIFWGYGGSYQVEGAGSGIVVGKNETELLVVTNNHVVEDTTGLTVQFTNDVTVEKAYVKGTDSDNDIAVVAIPLDSMDADTLQYIKIASLGDSNDMRVGDGVIAIGNALGYGQSLTVGYVSAKDREITTDGTKLKVIQTDAAINGGNSGGALLNMYGEVIGINVAKSSSTSTSEASVEGMGYAIPISEAKEIIEELSNKETRFPVDEDEQGFLGVKVITSDESSYQYYNIPKGAYIREVVEDGPADKAGLVGGDVIIKVDGGRISTADELIDVLGTYRAGETVKLTVMFRENRGYVEKTIEVQLTEKSDIS